MCLHFLAPLFLAFSYFWQLTYLSRAYAHIYLDYMYLSVLLDTIYFDHYIFVLKRNKQIFFLEGEESVMEILL